MLISNIFCNIDINVDPLPTLEGTSANANLVFYFPLLIFCIHDALDQISKFGVANFTRCTIQYIASQRNLENYPN